MARTIPVVVDYESYWSTEHSLTKMSPIAYVMHPETEIISVAYNIGGSGAHCIFGEENIRAWAQQVDWSDKMLIAHNNEGFDSMISAWRLGIKPKMWGCTLAMARPLHAKTTGLSLSALAKHYYLPDKGSLAATNTKGKHLKDFTPSELEAMRNYNILDTQLCYILFQTLLNSTSKEELLLIDMTIRMLVEPAFEVDRGLLSKTLLGERRRKHDSLVTLAQQLGVAGLDDADLAEGVRKVLASAPKFAAFLESRGVTPPRKISITTGRETYALAKTDEEFLALKEHPNPIVAAAAMARLDVKSTLLETRIESFLHAATTVGGKLPVPLKYYGADTTGRWCLAAGSQVRVKDSNGVEFLLPIERVTTDYMVWDGDAWVPHCGVEFSGDKEVVTWDGVTATPEHNVWIDADTKVTLAYAKDHGLSLWKGN